jgi:protein-S-isoprenylcysteine O-methyltransferase Ste14
LGIANPFFSPVVRLQSDRGHRVIESGPYKYMRHPGYFAMLISVSASAIAIGSLVALIPAIAFVWVICKRTRIEDQFLKTNLPGYAEYTERVPAGLPFMRNA